MLMSNEEVKAPMIYCENLVKLYKIGDIIIRGNLMMFETYLIICVIYFILTFTITRLLRLIEKKLEGKGNYTICGSQSDPNAEIKIRSNG